MDIGDVYKYIQIVHMMYWQLISHHALSLWHICLVFQWRDNPLDGGVEQPDRVSDKGRQATVVKWWRYKVWFNHCRGDREWHAAFIPRSRSTNFSDTPPAQCERRARAVTAPI